jgi:transcriptional regulator GlxA family with amidase domain
MRNVLIVLFDGVQSLDATGPLEVFAISGGYEVSTASLGGSTVRTTSGLRITPDADLRELAGKPYDLLLVPGDSGAREPDPDLVAWIRANAPNATRIASVCTGAFLLAEAGLLSGKRATTHWSQCYQLAAQYPDVTVDPDPIFVKDGSVATSAGITAGVDLALALVEDDLGRDAALVVARQLVVFLRRPGSQSQFSTQLSGQIADRAPLRDVQQWIAEHPADDLSVGALAGRANLSARQFARAFAAEIGMPPGKYVVKARLEAARRRLEDTTDGVEETARVTGYGTAEAMRRAFIRELGVSPAEYRRRFRPKEPALIATDRLPPRAARGTLR